MIEGGSRIGTSCSIELAGLLIRVLDASIRQSHEAAQEEQHAQAVPHDCEGNKW